MAENFRSNFVFGLQGNLYQEFIDKVSSSIIQEVIGTHDYEIISSDKHLSSFDFDYSKRKESIFPEFYLNFLSDIQKENNQVSFKKKVCITLDERLCNDICPNTGRKMTAIKLGGVELAYFIYFDIKEFFDFSYRLNDRELENIEIKDGYKSSQNGIKEKNNNQNNQLNPKKNNIDVANLADIDVSKLFSGKRDSKIEGQSEYTSRLGYIKNINTERRLSFIYDTPDNNSWFPIPHKDFPEIEKLPIGTVVKALGYFNNDKFFVDNYEVIDADELPFQLIKLKGTLETNNNSNYAIIKTNVGGVYTRLNLIKDLQPNIEHQVKCIAIEAYNKKRKEMGWEAIAVEYCQL